MGCDCWTWITKRQNNNTWQVVETYGKSKYPAHVYDYDNDGETDEVMCDQFYEGRDYTLFGLLAGVRADGDDYFTEVRGLPEDCPELLRHYHGGKNSDFHSATWYNLVELRAFVLYLKGQAEVAAKEIDYKLKYEPDYTVEDAAADRQYLWEQEQYESLRGYYEDAVNFLRVAGEDNFESHPEDYRVVVWFDS